ncbi:MAG: baseplate J/gp47 family protein [Oscillospiraceae bacterium]|jgi:uncharacterized phage protein gp47/JayE|nr:baseplate J/gp47 family protein [Oscillospiraceae bacterium]
MYEQSTYESILERMLSRVRGVSPELDTREGSLIFTALAPAAVELQLMYIELDTVLRETFADTQSRPFLARRAAERGITAKDGTKALRLGEFNTDVPPGSRFFLNGLYYTAVERRGEGKFALECETPGSRGNPDSGVLVPCEYIPKLTEALLTGVLTHGADPETTEQLRRRYTQSLSAIAFGGNIADYLQKAGALPGVGGVKVTPAWDGGGTVLLTITDDRSNSPAPGLVAEVQEAIDPVQGGGRGIAPIGHSVTVRGAREAEINITAGFALSAGYDWAAVRPQAEKAAADYIGELRGQWAGEDATVVRLSGLELRFLAVPGILDVTGTKLNGAAKNLTLPAGSLPKPGSVTNETPL